MNMLSETLLIYLTHFKITVRLQTLNIFKSSFRFLCSNKESYQINPSLLS